MSKYQKEVKAISISVGLVTYNEALHISKVLHALFAQTVKIDELIVVDNGSTDSTLPMLYQLQSLAPFPMRILRSGQNNIGWARHLIVQTAKSEWIAFLDPDCQPQVDWLHKMVDQLARVHKVFGAVSGVAGPNRLPDEPGIKADINMALGSPFLHGYSPQAWISSHAIKADHLPTTNCLLLKKSVVEAGGFSARQDRGGEDVELSRRMRAHLHTLVLVPQPVIINDCVQTERQWYLRLFRFGRIHRELLFLQFGFSHAPTWAALVSLPFVLMLLIVPYWFPHVLWVMVIYLGLVVGTAIRCVRPHFDVYKILKIARLILGSQGSYTLGFLLPKRHFFVVSRSLFNQKTTALNSTTSRMKAEV